MTNDTTILNKHIFRRVPSPLFARLAGRLLPEETHVSSVPALSTDTKLVPGSPAKMQTSDRASIETLMWPRAYSNSNRKTAPLVFNGQSVVGKFAVLLAQSINPTPIASASPNEGRAVDTDGAYADMPLDGRPIAKPEDWRLVDRPHSGIGAEVTRLNQFDTYPLPEDIAAHILADDERDRFIERRTRAQEKVDAAAAEWQAFTRVANAYAQNVLRSAEGITLPVVSAISLNVPDNANALVSSCQRADGCTPQWRDILGKFRGRQALPSLAFGNRSEKLGIPGKALYIADRPNGDKSMAIFDALAAGLGLGSTQGKTVLGRMANHIERQDFIGSDHISDLAVHSLRTICPFTFPTNGPEPSSYELRAACKMNVRARAEAMKRSTKFEFPSFHQNVQLFANRFLKRVDPRDRDSVWKVTNELMATLDRAILSYCAEAHVTIPADCVKAVFMRYWVPVYRELCSRVNKAIYADAGETLGVYSATEGWPLAEQSDKFKVEKLRGLSTIVAASSSLKNSESLFGVDMDGCYEAEEFARAVLSHMLRAHTVTVLEVWARRWTAWLDRTEDPSVYIPRALWEKRDDESQKIFLDIYTRSNKAVLVLHENMHGYSIHPPRSGLKVSNCVLAQLDISQGHDNPRGIRLLSKEGKPVPTLTVNDLEREWGFVLDMGSSALFRKAPFTEKNNPSFAKHSETFFRDLK